MDRSIVERKTAEIIAQVAELAGVKDVGSTYFSSEIDFHIDMYQIVDFRKNKALLKAELAVRAATEAVLALDKRDQVALRRALYNDAVFPAWWRSSKDLDYHSARSLVKTVWNNWPDELLIAFCRMTGSNPFLAPNNGRGGRPKGAVANWHLQNFVEDLWRIVHECGGNLYADHHREDGGTMIKALCLLAPLLPEGLIPNALPVPTIENIIKNFKANYL
jgi:hypothetical protein